MPPYLTAREAAAALGITLPTLYAYTSRGLLHSEPVPGATRERRYRREDVDRLRRRKQTRRDPDQAAALGLNWGSPVLASAITLIHEGALYYRGRDAVRLARTATLEDAAALLWSAEPGAAARLFDQPSALPPAHLARLRKLAPDPLTLLQLALPAAGALDPASHDLRPPALRQTGARILRLFLGALGAPPRLPVHAALHSLWSPRSAAAAAAIRTALVLCADHELNVSAFTARCAASAGASPYDVVAAAMATLKGARHGGATERVTALFREAATPARARAAAIQRLRRGESLPGFGHPLYPEGDPRASLLLDLVRTSGNASEARLARALARAGSDLLHEHPNVDFALAALARAFALPPAAPLLLFALGRTVGWMAHAIEQYDGPLIRPRARYTGPAPEAAS